MNELSYSGIHSAPLKRHATSAMACPYVEVPHNTTMLQVEVGINSLTFVCICDNVSKEGGIEATQVHVHVYYTRHCVYVDVYICIYVYSCL